MKKIMDMIEQQTIFLSAENVKKDFTNEAFYKNFVLGSEYDIVNEYIEKGFKSFKNFIFKSNTNNNAFNFFCQVHTSLERVMKIVLILSLDNYKDMDFRKYSHNLSKLLIDVKKICNFSDDEIKFINSLDGKYGELRYKNFDSLKLKKDRLSSGFHAWELIKWVNQTLNIKLYKGDMIMWEYDSSNEPKFGKNRFNLIVRSVEKQFLNICGKIAKYIGNESRKLNIYITEKHGRFYSAHNLSND